MILLVLIIGTVVYLSIRKPDVISVESDSPETAPDHRPLSRRTVLVQVVATLGLVVVLGGLFYGWRSRDLDAQAAAPPVAVTAGAGTDTANGSSAAKSTSPLGDMWAFIVITQDTLDLLNAGKQGEATNRITDLESAWDNAAATLQRRDKQEWHAVDDKIDVVLREMRAPSPNPVTEAQALQALLKQMG